MIRELRRERDLVPVLILISDGCANVSMGEMRPGEEAALVGEMIRAKKIRSIVLGTAGLSRRGRFPHRQLFLTALSGPGAPVVRPDSRESPSKPAPNVALDSAVIRAVSGSEQMVTHSGPFPAGSPAAATLAASENGHYVASVRLEETAMVVYAFDVDETLEVSKGPVKLFDLVKLREHGRIVGLCGNWAMVTLHCPDWHHICSFVGPCGIEKHEFLRQLRQYIPGHGYVMVGNILGISGASDDRGAAERAGWRFIQESEFAKGVRWASF